VPSWLLKAGAQGAISLLPGRHRVNRFLQEHVTRSLVLTQAGFESKLAQCRHHLTSFRRTVGVQRAPSTVLELGTGWYPIVPIGLALAGAERVLTVDVTSLLDRQRVAQVVQRYRAAFEAGDLQRTLSGLDPERALVLLDAAEARIEPRAVLEALGVTPVVGDARDVILPSRSVELFVSNNTLEHIPPGELAETLAAFRQQAAPGAVMDHFVDLSDHYAHFDRSLSEFNYLRYSSARWRLANNRLQYQNRLRASDYRALIEGAGFRVVAEEDERGEPGVLAAVRLAAPFSRYAEADLLVLRTWLTAVAEP
jgi:hypothetical protein